MSRKFWDVVAEIGWGTEHTDPDRGKEILMNLLPTWEEVESFREEHRELHSRLYATLDDYERKHGVEWGMGDDGFSDLINHIIGLGEHEYYSVIGKPELALRRAQAPYGSPRGYVESFSYCIPYASDFDTPEEKAKRRVQGIKSQIARIQEDSAAALRLLRNNEKQLRMLQAKLEEAERSLNTLGRESA